MQKKSLDTLKNTFDNYPHINSLLDFVVKIEKEESLCIIILFGSLVRGDYTQYSDIDVLCVFDKSFASDKERFLQSYQYSNGLVQTKTLSLQEFEQGLKNGNSFLHLIIEEGVIIHSKIEQETIKSWMGEGKSKANKIYYKPY